MTFLVDGCWEREGEKGKTGREGERARETVWKKREGERGTEWKGGREVKKGIINNEKTDERLD